jgi:hypothetical protein
MYTWKVLEGLVPNITENKIQIQTSYNNTNRRGRLCHIPTYIDKKAKHSIKSIFDNSFCVRGPKLFNKLPEDLRNMSVVPFETFKKGLDKCLSMVDDKPLVYGYIKREENIA